LLGFYSVFSFENVYSQHKNILISTENEPNEVSICINPKSPNIIAAGANVNNYFFSSDTGKTWRSGILESKFGVWGDPVIIVDTNQNFYFFHLSNPVGGSWIDRIVCQKSFNNGVNYNNGSYTGLNGKKIQDKHWAVCDRKSNRIYVTWTEFDKYESKRSIDSSNIKFSYSSDAGKTWSKVIRINKVAGDCSDSDNTVEGAVPTVGLKGEVYVAWASPQGIVFDKSLDSGKTWLKKDIFVSDLPGGWCYNIPGMMRCNGLPITGCDLSNSKYKGTIYINWSDQRNGEDNTDVWLVKSVDGGDSWSKPIKVNDDNSDRHQFLTWMSIDQTNGFLYFIFYDRRNYADSRTDVYMARSTDGGLTFENFKISERPFTPDKSVFMGDYNNVSVHNNIVRPIWTVMDNRKRLSVWTALIDLKKLSKRK
jgi:Neuraminidase (sialidase)